MLERYAIWDKTSDIFTPGTDPHIKGLTYSTALGTSRFTAAEWMQIHPAPPSAVIVCAAGDFNGAFFGTLDQLVRVYKAAGADFDGAKTDEDKLEVIEAFEDAETEASRGPSAEIQLEERIAAALELANLLNMPDEKTDDPDVAVKATK